MPRERQELFRESNSKEKEKIIVLAFEGNVTEEAYFEALMVNPAFNDELIYVHLLKREKEDTNSAPKHVFKKLKKEAKEEYNFNKADELWMIIDRDRWQNIPTIIELCKKEGNMHVAVSNPCFEFWLLLHIYKFSDLTEEEKSKILLNPKVSNNKRYVDTFLGNLLLDGYNKTNPKPERFVKNIKDAISGAKALVVKGEDYPLELGSYVFRVVEKIIKPQ